MSLSDQTVEVVAKEIAARDPEQRERIAQANERFERLVQAGVVRPERYNVQPASPSSPSSHASLFRWA